MNSKTILEKLENPKIFVVIVFAIFFSPRIAGLGLDVWNVDALRWNIRSDNFVEAMIEVDFKDTY